MRYNEDILSELLEAARLASCDIVHISKLAGDEPFVASRPCLGDHPEPLIEMTEDRYLAVMAALRRHLVVEHSQTIDGEIRTAGGSKGEAAVERTQLKPMLIFGHLDMDRAAVYYMMDSAGQETTIIYRGLSSASEMQNYWLERTFLVSDFSSRYNATEDDIHALCRRLDQTTDLSSVDVAGIARKRGLVQNATA